MRFSLIFFIRILMTLILSASIAFAWHPRHKRKRKKLHWRNTQCAFVTTCDRTSNQQLNQFDNLKNLSDHINSSAPWSKYPKEVMNYSVSSEVTGTIEFAMANKEAESKSYCARYVKDAMLAGHLLSPPRPGASMAIEMIQNLEERGFINIKPKYGISKPSDAPRGAVLVYKNKGTRKKAGHVEIKTSWGEDGGYVSDFYHEHHDGMSQFELVAVMVKPTSTLNSEPQ